MDSKTLKYSGFVPPCGIFCGGCPVFSRDKNCCEGAGKGCKTRKCNGIYVCCIMKKGLEFCHECKSYPCSRYKEFANRWKKYGQDLMENQIFIREYGKEKFLQMMNDNTR